MTTAPSVGNAEPWEHPARLVPCRHAWRVRGFSAGVRCCRRTAFEVVMGACVRAGEDLVHGHLAGR